MNFDALAPLAYAVVIAYCTLALVDRYRTWLDARAWTRRLMQRRAQEERAKARAAAEWDAVVKRVDAEVRQMARYLGDR